MLSAKLVLSSTGAPSTSIGLSSWYDVDNRSALTGSYDRVAFYIELTQASNDVTQWMLVTMDNYTEGDLSKLAIRRNTVEDFKPSIQTVVSNANAYAWSNADWTANSMNLFGSTTKDTVLSVTGVNAIIEFWSSGYGGGLSTNLPGIAGNGSAYDHNDTMNGDGTDDGHGSYQVHLYNSTNNTAQTAFAINHYRFSDHQMGIGTNTSGSPDWTNRNTSSMYSSLTLQMFVLSDLETGSYIWESDTGNWTDTVWQAPDGNSHTDTPGSDSPVYLARGSVTLGDGTTAAVGKITTGSAATLTLGGSLSAQGGSISNLAVSGANANLTNLSTSEALSLQSITGDTTSTLTLGGSIAFTPLSGAPIDYAGKLAGGATIEQTRGQVYLSGDNSAFSGTYTVAAGSLSVANSSSLIGNTTGTLLVKSGAGLGLVLGDGGFATADVERIAASGVVETGAYVGIAVQSGTQDFAGSFASSFNFAKTGAGRLNVTSNMGTLSSVRVFEGAMALQGGGAFSGDVVANKGAQFVYNNGAGSDTVVSNFISGDGELVIESGTVRYTTASPSVNRNGSSVTFDTATRLEVAQATVKSGATLYFGDGAYPQSTVPTTFNIEAGGTLEFNNQTNTTLNHVAGHSLNDAEAKMTITGSGVFKKTGAGITATYLQRATTATGFEMRMSEGGWVDVSAGTLINGGWSTSSTWRDNKGSLHIAEGATVNLWDGHQIIVDSLTGSGTLERGSIQFGIANNMNSTTYGVADNTATFSGIIRDTDSANQMRGTNLTKVGTGTQILSGNNTYAGTTTVSAGTLQFGAGGDTGTIGTGAVTVSADASLIFDTTAAQTGKGALSNAGTVTNRKNTTLEFSSITGVGTFNLEAGTLRSSYLGGATYNVSSGARVENTVAEGASTTLNANLSGDGTFVKSGSGTLVLQNAMPLAMELAGGTLSTSTWSNITSAPQIQVSEDSTITIPAHRDVNPWTLTLYKGSNSNHAHIEPTDDLTGVTVYTANGGDSAPVGFRGTTQPTSYDMAEAANNTSNDAVRSYLPNNSTLSYTTEVYIPEDIEIDIRGYFDDRAGLFICPVNEDGTLGDWRTLSAFGKDFNSSATGQLIDAGTYILDARVGDVGGNAYAPANVRSPDGTVIGLGIRTTGGSLTGNYYLPLVINQTTGSLAFADDQIISANMDTKMAANLEINNIVVDADKVLTLDNPHANHASVNLTADFGGTGTLSLTNSSGNNDIPFDLAITSDSGSLEIADAMKFTGSADVGGDLTIGDGAYFTADLGDGTDYATLLSAGGSVSIGDDFLLTILYNGAVPDGIMTYDIVSGVEGVTLGDDALVDFVFGDDALRGFMQWGDNGAWQLVLGSAASIPEPSTWALLVLGSVGMLFLRRSRRLAAAK
ncbi:MAG: autotransporter-associated beta strand repeat-containing protein [Planctomycetia bacterium]|nr:autotransporter-associated beta strand repeat-containing protein [Planctomycetia bacterium]